MVKDFRQKRIVMMNAEYLSDKIKQNSPTPGLSIDLDIINNGFPETKSYDNVDIMDIDITDDDLELWEHHFQLGNLFAFSYFPLSKSHDKNDDYIQAKYHFKYTLKILNNIKYNNQKKTSPMAVIEEESCNIINDINGDSFKKGTKKKKRKKRKRKRKRKTNENTINKIGNNNDMSNDTSYIKRKSMEFKQKFIELENVNMFQQNYDNKYRARFSLSRNKQEFTQFVRDKKIKNPFIIQDKKAKNIRKHKTKKLTIIKKRAESGIIIGQQKKKQIKKKLITLRQSSTPTADNISVNNESNGNTSFPYNNNSNNSNKYDKITKGFVEVGYSFGCFLYDLSEYKACIEPLMICIDYYKKEFCDPTCLTSLMMPPSTLFDDNGFKKINFRKLCAFIGKVFNKIQNIYDINWKEYEMENILQTYINNDNFDSTAKVEYINNVKIMPNNNKNSNNTINIDLLPNHCRLLINDYIELIKMKYKFGNKCIQLMRQIDGIKQFRECIRILNRIYVEKELKINIIKSLNNTENDMKNKNRNQTKFDRMRKQRRGYKL